MKQNEKNLKDQTKVKGDGHPENPTVPNRAHTEMKTENGVSACMTKEKKKKS